MARAAAALALVVALALPTATALIPRLLRFAARRPPPRPVQPSTRQSLSTQPRAGDETLQDVTLEHLTEVKEDGRWLNSMVTKWLDDEFTAMDVHGEIGAEVERIYVAERKAGTNDLTGLLLAMGAKLEQLDMHDAYVNGWDVANNVADYLMVRMQRETCACSAQPPEDCAGKITVGPKDVKKALREYDNDLARYKLAVEIADGSADWRMVNAVCAVMVGFRVCESDGSLIRDKSCTPEEWADLEGVPDMSDCRDVSLDERMERAFPVDPELREGLDMYAKTVIGEGLYAFLNEHGNQGDRRRLCIVRWLHQLSFQEAWPPVGSIPSVPRDD